MSDSKRRTQFIEEDETPADRQGFLAPLNVISTTQNEEARLRKRFPVKSHNYSEHRSRYERLVPVLTGSPWTHYEKKYAINYWCSFGVITSKKESRQSMIRTLTSPRADEQIAAICRLSHPGIVRNLEIYSCFDGSHFLISEFMATSVLHICRSPIYPTEQQLGSILHQMLCALQYLGENELVHEELSSAATLISLSGEVKISDIERCRRDGEFSRQSDSFCRIMMSLMDKKKPTDGAIGLTRPDEWSPTALELFTMASSQTNTKELLAHRFIEGRNQASLEWLVPFVLISASHSRD